MPKRRTHNYREGKPLSRDVIWQLWRGARDRHEHRKRQMMYGGWSNHPLYGISVRLSEWLDAWSVYLLFERDSLLEENHRYWARRRAKQNAARKLPRR